MWLCSPPRSPLPPDPQTVVVSIHRTPQTYGTTSPPFLALADTPPLCATALLLVVSAKISYKRMEDLPGSFKGTAENPYQNVSIRSTKPASSLLKALCILETLWSGRRAILRMCDFPRMPPKKAKTRYKYERNATDHKQTTHTACLKVCSK